MKRILYMLVLLPTLAIAQTQSENYIKSTSYKVPTLDGINATDGSGAVTPAKKTVNVTYFDGLGRPIQNIAHMQSGSGKDIITAIGYDEFGRESIKYLPYQKGTSDMNFDPNSILNTQQFYASPTFAATGNPNFESTTNAYSKTFFDSSPLNRPLKQAAPGNDWVGNSNNDADKTIKYVYATNSDTDQVRNFYVSNQLLACYGNYLPNQLYKKITKDENWTSGKTSTVEEFKDSQERIILKRAYESETSNLDTYYVYDSSGNLSFVVPPLASASITTVNVTQTPYTYTQSIPLSELLFTFNGGGGGSVIIENNTFKVSFSSGFSSTQINTAKTFTINASQPIPDMTIGTLQAGFGRYTVYVQNNQLKFTDNYPNSGTYTSLNHTLSVPFDTSIFGTIPVYSTTVSQDRVTNLCYQYKYDGANRLIEKKIPGKQWEYIVYDRLDRIVATGPAYSPFSNLTGDGWLITKYDSFNRTVVTGWMPSATITSAVRTSIQNENDAQAVMYTSENKILSSATVTVNGIAIKYDNYSWPASTTRYHILTVTYYDNYTFPDGPTAFSVVLDGVNKVYYDNATKKPQGLLTGSLVRVLTSSTATEVEKSFVLYNDKARPIRSYMTNHLGGYTYTDSKLKFSGDPEYLITYHKRNNTLLEIKTREDLTYSDQDRLLARIHKTNSWPGELIASNEYDELGQLINKKVGGTDVTGSTGLQKVHYSYNVRGWLKEINNVDNLMQGSDPKDLFAFKINYNNVENVPNQYTGKTLYNGNISETYWKTSSDNVKRKYGYFYDNMNRLVDAVYQKPGATTEVTGAYDESIRYDKNGNISFLQRYGYLDGDSTNNRYEIDRLQYQYDPNTNILRNVTDETNSLDGFRDGVNQEADYYYDANGNLTADLNKGIRNISYNHLNLPTRINFQITQGEKFIDYIYNALGKKVGKRVVNQVPGMEPFFAMTDYLDGFQYVNTVLQFFPTPEGYVSVTNGDRFNYVYNYTDHLGNIRLSYTQEGSVLKILEENHYYPFGMQHSYNRAINEWGGNPETGIYAVVRPVVRNKYQYKYNGKEFQDELGLNMYDYGARNYDPAIGRWNVTDGKAELYFGRSPYCYALNTPVQAIDPDGNLVIFINGQHTGDGGKSDYWKTTENVQYSTAFGPMMTKRAVNFDQAVMDKLGDYNAIYRDGSMGGFANTFTGGGSIFGTWGTIFGTSNLNVSNRINGGYSQGMKDAKQIIASLARDKEGNIVESIKIISHSMGGAYAKGYAKAILEYAKKNNIKDLIIAFEADFAPFQPDKQSAVKGRNMGATLQFSHSEDSVAGNKPMAGAENQDTSEDSGQGHSIFDFINQIQNLPSGTYTINGIKVKIE